MNIQSIIDTIRQINPILLIAGAAVLVLAIVTVIVIVLIKKRRGGKHLDMVYFTRKWREMQKLCADASTWPLAIIDADKILDEALRKSKVKGKTMGERLVTVQRMLTDNDSVWFAHKLRNKLVHEEFDALKEKDVKQALIGFRQALKDLGALK